MNELVEKDSASYSSILAKFVEADINSGIKEKKYEDMINDLEKLLP